MKDPPKPHERRSEQRHYYHACPVLWRHDCRDRWRYAWLHDLSTHGIAIRIPRPPLPDTGHTIQLARFPNTPEITYTITRKKPLANHDQLIAGKRVAN